jgi:hypothetical protein
VPCGNSDTKNSIFVTIPVSQVAPYWATRYKFVIKADRDTYETIYSNIFFVDPEQVMLISYWKERILEK